LGLASLTLSVARIVLHAIRTVSWLGCGHFGILSGVGLSNFGLGCSSV